MQKIRNDYIEVQSYLQQNPSKLTVDYCNKKKEIAAKAYQQMALNQQYEYLEEIDQYREKYEQLCLIHKQYEGKNKNEQFNKKMRSVFKKDASFLTPNYHQQPPKQQKIQKKNHSENVVIKQKKSKELNQQTSNFRAIIDQMSSNSRKYPIKDKQEKVMASRINEIDAINKNRLKQDEQIFQLQKIICELRSKVQMRNKEQDEKIEELKLINKRYAEQVSNITQEISLIRENNRKIKQDNGKIKQEYSNTVYVPKYLPIYTPNTLLKSQKQKRIGAFPYNYMPNDIGRFQKRYYNRQQTILSNQVSKSPKNISVNRSKDQKLSNNYTQKTQKQNKNDEFLFTKSNLKFRRSQINDEVKNIAVRSKISFFKSQMIIYRGKDFQIAIRSKQKVRLQQKIITIFFNNKENQKKSVKIGYKYDRSYYEVAVKEKLRIVDQLKQSKEVIEIKLIKFEDLDSIIEAKLQIDDKSIHFLIPTTFLEFTPIEKQITSSVMYQSIKLDPIYQFSNLKLAQQILPLKDISEKGQQIASIHCVSKNYSGEIYLKWMNGQLQVKTIPCWKLFISYLLLKSY